MHRDAARLLLPAALAGTVAGAELVVRDLGVRVESLPTAFDYRVASDGFDRAGTDYFRTAIGLAGGGRYSLAGAGRAWGPVLGVDLALADAGNSGARLTTVELRGVAALAWQMDHRWTAMAQLAAGLGWGRMSLDQGGTGTGQLTSITPGLALWWRVGDSTRLTIDAGWRMCDATLHHGGTDIDLSQSGTHLAIGFSWGLSQAPWSLE